MHWFGWGRLPPDVERALAAADAGGDALGGALQRLGGLGVLDPHLLPVVAGERGRDVGEGLRLRRRRGEDGRQRERQHGRRLAQAEARHNLQSCLVAGTVASG